MNTATNRTIAPFAFEKVLSEKGPDHVSILDVRTPAEHRECHIEGSLLIPLDTLGATSIDNLRGSDAPLYVLCRSGKRACAAIEKLEKAGLDNCVLVEGGLLACQELENFPLVRSEKKTISLERQVRIAAGALVAIGSLLAWALHPLWLILPAFVGVGLVFAGITDTCAMGMLISKAPWNR